MTNDEVEKVVKDEMMNDEVEELKDVEEMMNYEEMMNDEVEELKDDMINDDLMKMMTT